MDKNIAQFIEEVFGVKPIYINLDTENIADTIKQNTIKNEVITMIKDAESIAKDIIDNNDKTISIDVRNAGIALANAIKFNNEDAKIVGIENTKKLATFLNIIRIQFNDIAIKQLNRINDIICDLSAKTQYENNEEDLTKLSKEELIARLREKSK